MKHIDPILFTAEVSNPERSRDLRLRQSPNIECIFVTAEVLSPERLRDLRFEQQ